MKTLRHRRPRLLGRSLPLHEAARLKQSLNLVGQLDHPRMKIQMTCDRAPELGRKRSCDKESETMAWMEQRLQMQPASVFFDIGANVGAYSHVATALVGGSTRVFAFEPGAATYAAFVKNIDFNKFGEIIHPVPLALADGTRPPSFITPPPTSVRPVMARTSPPGKAPKTSSHFAQQVLCFGMDEFIESFHCPRPNLLKIDVYGAELQVLQGAARTLSDPGLKSVLIELYSSSRSPLKRWPD